MLGGTIDNLLTNPITQNKLLHKCRYNMHHSLHVCMNMFITSAPDNHMQSALKLEAVALCVHVLIKNMLTKTYIPIHIEVPNMGLPCSCYVTEV